MERTIDKIVEDMFSGNEQSASALYKQKVFDKEGGAPEDFELCGTIIPKHYLEVGWDVVEVGWIRDGRAPGGAL